MSESSPEVRDVVPDEEISFKEKIKSLSFGKVPGGNRPTHIRKKQKQNYNSWERGVPTEKRPGGFEMPYLDPDDDYKLIRQKAFGERRHEIEQKIHRLDNAPSHEVKD